MTSSDPETTETPPSTRRRIPLKTVLGGLWWVIAMIFFVVAWRQFVQDEIDWKELRSQINGWWLGAAIALQFISQIIRSQVGYASLTTLGYPIKRLESYRYYSLSQIGKYVPGGVWQYAARTVFYQQHGMRAVLSTAVVTWETSAILLSAILIALVGTPAIPQIESRYVLFIAAGGVLIIIGIAIIQFEALWAALARRRIPGAEHVLLVLQELTNRRMELLLRLSGVAFTSWLASGLGFYLTTRALLPAGILPPLSALVIFTSSWVLGFLFLIAPGGIGTREAVLTALIAPATGVGTALIVAVAGRIWWTLAETLGFLAASMVPYITRTWQARRRKPGPESYENAQ